MDLSAPYALPPDSVSQFRTNGYVRLKEVLSAEKLAHYGPEINRQTMALNDLHLPMEERTTYQQAFLQVMNLWQHSDVVREFVFSKRLARIAATLLEVDGVRLYHDQSLYKEPSGGLRPRMTTNIIGRLQQIAASQLGFHCKPCRMRWGPWVFMQEARPAILAAGLKSQTKVRPRSQLP